MSEVDCPRAKTWMTPCIARDGHLALSDDDWVCVGCSAKPRELLRDLSGRYPPAARYLQTKSPKQAADTLTRLVAAYVNDMPSLE